MKKKVELVLDTGVGKTHLAIAIGNEVAIKINSVYFIKFAKLISNLKKAHNEGEIERNLNYISNINC